MGTGLFLIAVGAILRYAVNDNIDAINLETAGLILMIVGAIAFVVGAIWAFGHRRPRDEGVVRARPARPPRPALLSGRQLELGEHGPVIAAGQLLDRVVADPDAPVDEHVVDHEHRRDAAVVGPGRVEPVAQGRRDVVVAAVEQVAEVALVEGGVEVAEEDSQRLRLRARAGPSDRRPTLSSTPSAGSRARRSPRSGALRGRPPAR